MASGSGGIHGVGGAAADRPSVVPVRARLLARALDIGGGDGPVADGGRDVAHPRRAGGSRAQRARAADVGATGGGDEGERAEHDDDDDADDDDGCE